ncbi:hypothetical protein [Streptomyces sp. NPDC051561]|uniref:hypothetical protein n=1 Tax=Streptomyces sp. NPDC051561 TaxID=3365658 RepID=UPI0037A77D30
MTLPHPHPHPHPPDRPRQARAAGPVTTYRTELRFTLGGPKVAGFWENRATADRTLTSWIGLYGSHPQTHIRLVEVSAAGERLLQQWPKP